MLFDKTPEEKLWGFQEYNTIEDRIQEEQIELDAEKSALLTALSYKSLIGPWWSEQPEGDKEDVREVSLLPTR